MSAEPPPPVAVVGLSHRTSSLDLREAVAFPPDEARDFLLAGLRAEAWSEAMLLSTCNRTELYARPGPAMPDGGALLARLHAARPVLTANGNRDVLYSDLGEGALRRLVRVACGLDSMVLGEMQITGQIREAHRLARDAGASGPVLDRVVPGALKVSVRVRTETGISRGITSVPAAAMALARRHFDSLRNRRVLVVGAGDAGSVAARLLAGEKPGGLWVANRTPARAADLAGELRAIALPWDRVPQEIGSMDIVLCATRAPEPVLTLDHLRATASQRAGRMLVLLDIGVPRNIDPRVRDLEGVFLYDLDALETLVSDARRSRAREIGRVETIIEAELAHLLADTRRGEVEPLVADLRHVLEDLRRREVERGMRHFDDAQREHVEHLTRSLIDKAFHAPMRTIREMGRDEEKEGFLRRLFGLGDGEDRGR